MRKKGKSRKSHVGSGIDDFLKEEGIFEEAQAQPRREKREESFMPVEITGAWVRAEKGIGGRIVLGVVCAGVLRFSG